MTSLSDIVFANPERLWLLVIPIALILYRSFKPTGQAAFVRYAGVDGLNTKTFKTPLGHILFALRQIALCAIIVAIARPQSNLSWQNVSTEGIDIVIAMDISGSMLAQDFSPDRLEAAKAVAERFILDRKNDRIGLVVYAAKSYTQCPMTTDHTVLLNLLGDIRHGLIKDGTAIGNGLATAVDRLRDSGSKSKVVILLTDGTNNAGEIPPLTAAEVAKTFGVKVYTIGVGTTGMAPYPVRLANGQTYMQRVPVQIDENTLQQIAEITSGKYYRAQNNDDLKTVYQEIDQLEKTEIEVTEFQDKEEEFLPLVWIAGVLMLIAFAVDKTVLRRIT